MIIFLLNYILSFFFQIILFPPSFLSYLCTFCPLFLFILTCLIFMLQLAISSSLPLINFLFYGLHSIFASLSFIYLHFHLLVLHLFLAVPLLFISSCSCSCSSVVLLVLLLLLLVISSSWYFYYFLFLLLSRSLLLSISPFYFFFLFLFLLHNLFLLFFLTRGSNASETSECRIGLHRKKR